MLEQLARQAYFSPFAVLAAMGLIAHMAAPLVPGWLLAGWLTLVVLMQVVRLLLFTRLHRMSHIPVEKRMRVAALVNLVNTVLNALPLVCFPYFTPYERALQSLLLVSMGAASTFTAAGYRPFALAHLLCGLLPLYLLWGWLALSDSLQPVELALALLGFLYMANIYSISRHIYSRFEDGMASREKLRSALDEAESAGRAKTRFLAAASHDLRQPVHTLGLFSAALGMRTLDERTAQIAGNINEAVSALAGQLDALLDVSRLDAGIVEVNAIRFSLPPMLERLALDSAAAAQDKGIRLQLDCPEKLMVRSDPLLLERILRNLVNNAIAHNESCQVVIRVRQEGGRWSVTVADDGQGIPEAEQAKIFEEFYQIHNPERDRSRGLGLGLAIVQRLTRLMELDLDFESQAGHGTRFTLPLSVEAHRRRERESPPVEDFFLRDRLVLAVDDEPGARDGMRAVLESLGCRVATADSTDAALAVAARERPAVALVDFRLRGDDSGLRTIAALRELHPGTPMLLVSGDTAPDRLRLAAGAGVPLLTKPVLLQPLREALESCVPRSGDDEFPGGEQRD